MTVRRNLVLAYGLVGLGVVLIIGAALIIYWPAAVALGGIGFLTAGALLVQVDQPQPPATAARLRR